MFPTRERENGLFREKPSTKAVFPFSRGKNRISQGVENRGSLISVPLALRGVFMVFSGSFREVSGCFQDVFPYALPGHALWTLPKFPNYIFSFAPFASNWGGFNARWFPC